MIDVHSHTLFGIDDGSDTLLETLEILKEASNNGVTDLIMTPHYIKNSEYNSTYISNKKIFNKIRYELKKRKIKINIYLGNEVYIDSDVDNLLKNKEITTLNQSRYLLIELPMNTKCMIIDEVLRTLKNVNITPVIAHPERYVYYYKNIDFFRYLVDNGCILQGNIGSLFGDYGSHAKEMIKLLLKEDLIKVLGSDVHHNANVYTKHIQEKLKKLVKDDKKVDDLLKNNALCLIENREMK